jgi:hypothetical protein
MQNEVAVTAHDLTGTNDLSGFAVEELHVMLGAIRLAGDLRKAAFGQTLGDTLGYIDLVADMAETATEDVIAEAIALTEAEIKTRLNA